MLAPPSLFKHNLLSSVPRAPVGVLWVSPIPRTYTYLYESGSVKSFAELLTNIFIPLWEVGIPPPPFPFLEARAKVPKHVMPCFRVSSQAAGWQAPPYGDARRGPVAILCSGRRKLQYYLRDYGFLCINLLFFNLVQLFISFGISVCPGRISIPFSLCVVPPQVSIDPSRDPKLSYFMDQFSGFDCVDNEAVMDLPGSEVSPEVGGHPSVTPLCRPPRRPSQLSLSMFSGVCHLVISFD